MPEFALSPGVTLFYQDDDFTEPWRTAEVALLVHGSCESSRSWNAWMPHLASKLRVIRPDTRGFGRSTPMPEDHAWSFDEIADDFERLMDSLGIERFHVVAAKVGGPMAIRLAATRPQRVQTLTLVGTPGSASAVGSPEEYEQKRARIRRDGIAAWARGSMKDRLGSACSAEMLEGWTQLMAATTPSTHVGFSRDLVARVDLTGDLPRIECPTLVITTVGSKLGSVETTRSWQEKIRSSQLLVLPGDSYHAAATHADVCAKATLAFIADHSSQVAVSR